MQRKLLSTGVELTGTSMLAVLTSDVVMNHKGHEMCVTSLPRV